MAIEQYTKDIIEDVKENPLDWVAYTHHGTEFKGIKNSRNGNKVYYYIGWCLVINGIEMPLSMRSDSLLKKLIKGWTLHVPALHLQGDVALIQESKKRVLKLVGGPT